MSARGSARPERAVGLRGFSLGTKLLVAFPQVHTAGFDAQPVENSATPWKKGGSLSAPAPEEG